MLDVYFMSPPSPGWAIRGRANFRSREAEPVDAARARAEWLTLAEAIEEHGGTVVALVHDDDTLTGMPYAAECGHVVEAPASPGAPGGPTFLLPRMAAPHRARERERWEPFARSLGLRVVDPGEGTWEAQGDVATFDGATLLFYGGRTDRRGMEAARRCFPPGEILELAIREPAFHGNMALLPLPAVDRLLVCREVFEPASFAALVTRVGERRVELVTEDEIRSYATNGLPMGDTLLAPHIVPERVLALVKKLGMRVRVLELAELCAKAGGASRCLVSYARLDERALTLPREALLPAVREALTSARSSRG